MGDSTDDQMEAPSPSDPADASGEEANDAVEALRKQFVEGEAPSQQAEETTEETEPSEEPQETEPEFPAPEGQGEEPAPEPEATDEEVVEPEEDPFGEDFTDEDRKRLGKRAEKRIKQLHAEGREAKQQVIELQEKFEDQTSNIKVGQYFNDLVDKHNLDPQDVDTAMNLAIGVVHHPRNVIPVLEQLLDQVHHRAGIPRQSAAPASLAPFQGQLSNEMQDLIDVYGMDETRVRMWAAAENLGARAQAQPPTPAPAPAPAPVPQAQPAPQEGVIPRGETYTGEYPTQATEPQVDAQAEQVANMQISTHLTRNGIPPEKQQDMLRTLWPLMVPFSPNGDPRQLSLENRVRVVELALEQHQMANRPRRTAPRDPAPVGGGGAPTATRTTTEQTAPTLEDLKKRFVG